MNIIDRKNGLFIINEDAIKKTKQNLQIKNILYAEICKEFIGSIKSNKYKNLNTYQRFLALNEFAKNWLKDRNLLNE